MSHQLAIAILNYNGLAHLKQYLPALLKQATAEVGIYVIDNASSDGSVLWLAQQAPTLQIIALPANYGFAQGYNLGLAKVEATWYLLLNNDVRVPDDFCRQLLQVMAQTNSPTIYQCNLHSITQPNHFEYAGGMGGWLDSLGYPFCAGRVLEHCEADTRQYAHNVQHLMWASGGAMLLPAAVYQQLQGFYAPLFMQNEDIEFCWRAQLRGIAIRPLPQVVVHHVGAGSLAWQHPRKTYYTFRSNLIMLLRLMPVGRLCWVLPLRLLLDAAAGLRYLMQGKGAQAMAILKGWAGAISWWLKPAAGKWPGQRQMPAAGWYKGSVVWAYFVRGRKTFAEIVQQPRG